MNRNISLALLLPLAISAAAPRVIVDDVHRWEAVWSLGSWSIDSSGTSRIIQTSAYGNRMVPGALQVPIAEAILALPPTGSWSVQVQRDSTIELVGSDWTRAPGWAQDPIRSIEVAPVDPTAWTEETTPQGRLLHLSIPWAERATRGLVLSRQLRVSVTMTGNGSASLSPILRSLISNPIGSARFGAIKPTTATLHSVAARGVSEKASIVPDGNQTLIVSVKNSSVGELGQDGVVRITGSQVRSALGSLNGVAFDRVAVAAPPRGSISRIADSAVPSGELSSIPIRRVDIDGDGVFDNEDRIEFFAQGPSFWSPDPELDSGLFALSIHPWDMTRRYVIRLDADAGSSELPTGIAPRSPVEIATTTRPVWAGGHVQLRVPEIGSPSTPDHETGSSWFWYWADAMRLDSVRLRHAATRDLPGLVGATGRGVVRFGRLDPSSSDTLRTYAGLSSPGNSVENRIVWNLTGLRVSDNRWTWSTKGSSNDFESYSVEYPFLPAKSLGHPFPTPILGSFSLPVTGGTSSDSLIAVVRGVGTRILPLTGGVLRDSSTDLDTWYVPSTKVAVSSLSAWKPPTGSRTLLPGDLASDIPSFDMLVVAPDSFLDIASQYAEFRSSASRIRPLSTRIIRAEDIWLQWGHGSIDPLAIRDMLRKAVSRWGVTHVLLMGGGHFDPRGVTGAPAVAIPIWEDQDVGTDAILTYLDPDEMRFNRGRTQDVALGRIPARSRGELAAWFAKERAWEDPTVATAGPWRNTILSVADDMQAARGAPDPIYEPNGSMSHTEASERIAQAMVEARPWILPRKVYEVEYTANANYEKPDAQRALIDQLNRGVAAWHYMGHGGFDILSDERLLDTRSALLGLTNAQSPHIFYAGSCTVGRFDMVDNRGLSEALVVAASKGAVASIAGSRPSFPDDNERLAKAFWSRVLVHDDAGKPRTLGEAFQQAQNSFSSGASDQQLIYPNSSIYNLLGDPAMVPFPAGSPLSLENPPDTIKALDAAELRGAAESDVQISLIGPPSAQVARFTYASKTYKQSYRSPGRTLVSLKAKSRDGNYLARLITPARIPFGDTASLVVYGWNPTTLRDSAILNSGIPMAGIGSNPPSDDQGPLIRILPCDSSWTAGQPFGKIAEIPVPFCLNILFDDSSGISSNDAPDEGIILSVPGTLDPWHPSQVEEGNNFSQAWTRLSLDAKTFQAGKTYTLNVFARDLMGNASTKSVELHTRKAGEVDLYEVFNRPNPVKGNQTTFYFKLLADADSNGTVPGLVQASIRIHTISGKLIRILNTDLTDVGHPRPRAVWNLQDSFRNEVANGLYPYTILLRVKDEAGGNWRQLEKRGIIAVSR